MLVEFRVSNYLCFRDEQVLSMVASADDALPDNVIEPPEDSVSRLRLLRSIVVYGANASGKTKLLEALQFVRRFVTTSANLSEGETDRPISVMPFLLDPEFSSQPSEFELTFIQDGVRYQYGFVADNRHVYGEYLYYAPKGRTAMLFERSWDAEKDEETYRFGSSLKGQNKSLSERTRSDALFLSVAAAWNHPQLSHVYAWFAQHLRGLQAQRIMLRPFVIRESEEYHTSVQKMLCAADLGITDYQFSETSQPAGAFVLHEPVSGEPDTAKSPKRFFRIEMLHVATDGNTVPIPIDSESEGTRLLFVVGTQILEALENGYVLFIDELDASLHPMLVHALVEMFHNPDINRCNAQLIFNTHDTTLLDQSLFRRDQVWFTEKDADGAAHLYPLLEFSPRKNEALAKGYLQGRYGAIPFLGDFSFPAAEGECK